MLADLLPVLLYVGLGALVAALVALAVVVAGTALVVSVVLSRLPLPQLPQEPRHVGLRDGVDVRVGLDELDAAEFTPPAQAQGVSHPPLQAAQEPAGAAPAPEARASVERHRAPCARCQRLRAAFLRALGLKRPGFVAAATSEPPR